MDAGKREEFRRAQRSANGPAWRSKAAQAMTKPDCNDAQIWDRLTIDAAKNHALRAAGASDKERADAFPLIEATMTLQNDANKTEVIKLMILVDSPIGAIAEKVGITPEVAEIWELLHFDVRQMQGATSWLSIHVVDGECKAGNTALAARMKLALVAGVEGVNAMLDMDAGVPIDEAHRLFQRRLNLELKLDAAANAPTHTERSRMAFIRLYADLQLAQQRLDLANKKLAARCAEARNRYDLAKIQIENLRERQAVTANKKEQLAERRRRAEEERIAQSAVLQERINAAILAAHDAAALRAAQSPLAQVVWGQPGLRLATPSESILPFQSRAAG